MRKPRETMSLGTWSSTPQIPCFPPQMQQNLASVCGDRPRREDPLLGPVAAQALVNGVEEEIANVELGKVSASLTWGTRIAASPSAS
jgi:hypothetical protein